MRTVCVSSPCRHLCKATVLHTAWTEMYREYKTLCERCVCHPPAGISVRQQYYIPHGLKCTENIRRYANGVCVISLLASLYGNSVTYRMDRNVRRILYQTFYMYKGRRRYVCVWVCHPPPDISVGQQCYRQLWYLVEVAIIKIVAQWVI